ncbi:hypothetical protein [Chondrinema litorale]|uniref:hypothetical protein n=1 Tax=Chondrinema litorale TaxID=2994555 RepID=UPI0025430BFA|nr:hypothetical protein [Chondrinema litorale]UZR95539.1 hypothetical protein OQ292_06895 [Chondrinema litorale]
MEGKEKLSGNIYKVPENYFEKLPEQIQSSLPKKSEVGIFNLLYLKPALLASMVLGFILYGVWPISTAHEPAVKIAFEDISKEDLKNYLLYTDISENEIIEEMGGSFNDEFFIDEDIKLSTEEIQELIDVEQIEDYL